MQKEEIIRLLIAEGKSLTRNEREKAAGPYDSVYLTEKIKYYTKRVNLARGVVFIFFIDVILALLTVLYYESLSPTSLLWLKGTLILLTVLSLFGLPILKVNHGRNASVLRLIKTIRESEAKG